MYFTALFLLLFCVLGYLLGRFALDGIGSGIVAAITCDIPFIVLLFLRDSGSPGFAEILFVIYLPVFVFIGIAVGLVIKKRHTK